MCGIAGIVHLDGKPCSAGLLACMSRQIRHRGPDDEGTVFVSPAEGTAAETAGPNTSIGLAHRRYSIIDLTPAGHQPFLDSDRRCCVISNGEIYNYVELRSELEALGHRFRSASDTEVIVEAYKEWGPDCFARFHGMWALALYDFPGRRLILSRDRIGKRPLYWARVADSLHFASEIKALLAVPEISDRAAVNEEAIAGFLRRGLRDLNNSTCFRDIYTLPAACYAVVDSSFPRNARFYWRLPTSRLREKDITVPEACTALRDALRTAVSIRLRADVPWAVELSGGMDSSVLVALASEFSCAPVATYTVRFPDKGSNEEPYARSVGTHFATDYRVIDYPTGGFWPEILEFTRLEEEPYHSPNLHANQVIRRHMREAGVRMLLNGAGGDELFAGYPEYFPVYQLDRLKSGRFPSLLTDGLSWTESGFPLSGFVKPLSYLWSGRGKPSRFSLAGRLQGDMREFKMPYWLRSGDKTHMGLPIESRNPFLDHRVVELAFQMPVSYLIRGGWHKWILRKAFEGILPNDVLRRPRKMGFPFPYKRFFSEARPVIEEISKVPRNPFGVRAVSGSDPRAWRHVSFLLWYELYFRKNLALFEKIIAMAPANRGSSTGAFTPEYLHWR